MSTALVAHHVVFDFPSEANAHSCAASLPPEFEYCGGPAPHLDFDGDEWWRLDYSVHLSAGIDPAARVLAWQDTYAAHLHGVVRLGDNT